MTKTTEEVVALLRDLANRVETGDCRHGVVVFDSLNDPPNEWAVSGEHWSGGGTGAVEVHAIRESSGSRAPKFPPRGKKREPLAYTFTGDDLWTAMFFARTLGEHVSTTPDPKPGVHWQGLHGGPYVSLWFRDGKKPRVDITGMGETADAKLRTWAVIGYCANRDIPYEVE